MRSRSTSVALAAAVAASLLVAACDEAEQGRILQYEKGTYLGQPDQELSDEQRAELRARTLRQRGL